MPELPEVEVIRRGLAAHAVGRTLDDVDVLHPRAVRRHVPGAVDLSSRLAGRKIAAARRRGKYLWLDLGDPMEPGLADAVAPGGEALLVHLGMSGQLLVQPDLAAEEKHLRIRFRFTDGGSQVRFVDQRTFGGVLLADLVDGVGGVRVPTEVAHIAPDPLETLFDVEAAVAALRARRTGVKRALLDQTLVSGIGNIYADEALWRVGLHFARPTATLTRPDARRLLAAVTAVMGEALQAGGTSFDALYVNVNGESGYFERSLAVYGQQDRPCPRCGTSVRRDSFMNRSAYTCPKCQPRPRNAHW